jgi:serine/threonine protein kinase
MQFADGGNLRQYLKEHFSELTWDDRLKFSYQIAEGIKYLHDEDIFHQKLHPKNVVIHKKEAKIILVIIKSTETDSLNVSDEMIPYVDPKLLENQSYEYDKKSDIYSLGVLMWELTSGYPPFTYSEIEDLLEIHLINGHRENPMPNTPNEYLDLYKSCWDPEPSERLSINQVFSKLGKMLYTQNKTNLDPSELIDFIKNNRLTKIIDINELSTINGNTTWRRKDTPSPVICKKVKCTQLNEVFIHELKMHRKLNFCSRIIHIIGISLGRFI